MRSYCIPFLLFLSLLSASVAAQSSYGIEEKVSWGIRGGLNLSSIEGDMERLLQGSKVKSQTHLHMGVILDFSLLPEVYLQSGLFLVNKGFKLKGSTGSESFLSRKVTYEIENRATYVQIPILFSVRPSLNEQAKLHADMGGYVAYGVSGNQKVKHFSNSGYTHNELKGMGLHSANYFGSNGDFNRFDLGVIFGTGISFYKIYLGFQYEMGLINTANQGVWDGIIVNNRKPSFKTSNAYLTTGYTF